MGTQQVRDAEAIPVRRRLHYVDTVSSMYGTAVSYLLHAAGIAFVYGLNTLLIVTGQAITPVILQSLPHHLPRNTVLV